MSLKFYYLRKMKVSKCPYLECLPVEKKKKLNQGTKSRAENFRASVMMNVQSDVSISASASWLLLLVLVWLYPLCSCGFGCIPTFIIWVMHLLRGSREGRNCEQLGKYPQEDEDNSYCQVSGETFNHSYLRKCIFG